MAMISVPDYVAAEITKQAEKHAMTKGEYVEYLVHFHDLQFVDLIVTKIREKHFSVSLTPAQKAGLLILKDYIESLRLG